MADTVEAAEPARSAMMAKCMRPIGSWPRQLAERAKADGLSLTAPTGC